MTCNENVSERLDRLERETATSGWDGPSSAAIPAARWAEVRACLAKVVESGFQLEPFVAPCTDGSVHVRWSDEKTSVTVEFADNEQALFYSITRRSMDVAATLLKVVMPLILQNRPKPITNVDSSFVTNEPLRTDRIVVHDPDGTLPQEIAEIHARIDRFKKEE